MKETTPVLREVGELRRQRSELDQKIAELTPQAIEEGYTAGLRPEDIAVTIGISVSRVHQIRRATRQAITGSDNAEKGNRS